MELVRLLEAVHDRASFLVFVAALVQDRSDAAAQAPGVDDWENITIEQYLDAALAWADADEARKGKWFPEEPSWKAFATFLYAGKIYE